MPNQSLTPHTLKPLIVAVLAAIPICSLASSDSPADQSYPSFNGLGMSNQYRTWQDITIKNDQQIESPDGINLSPSGNGPFEFNVNGHTDIYLVAKAADNDSAGDVMGMKISSSNNAASNERVVKATFNTLSIYAEGHDPQKHRVKGIWIYGGDNMLPGSPDNPAPSTVTINGDTNITAISTNGFAFGINVGDELGNQNGLGTGIIYLKGNKNTITVTQSGRDNQGGWARASGGIVASNRAHVYVEGHTTNITTKTEHVNSLATVQGGIILDRSSTLETTNTVNIDSTVAKAGSFNILYGISLDYIASCMYQDETGSVANLKGTTNITLRTNAQTIGYGLVSYGNSSITADGPVSVKLDDSQKNIGGINRFGAVYAGSTYTKLSGTGSSSYIDGMYGGLVQLNGDLTVNLPDTMKPGRENVYALVADGETSKPLKRNPTIIANGGVEDIYQLHGNVNADRDGHIELSMANSESFLTGWANNHADDPTKNGFIDISLKNGAVWNVISTVNSSDKVTSEASVIDTLELDNGVLNLTYASRNNLIDWEGSGHRQTLHITGTGPNQGISGSSGTIWMDINLADEGNKDSGLNLDQIIVDGTTAGTHSLNVNFTNGLASISGNKYHSENWLIEQNSGSMTLTGPNGTNSFTGQGMVSMWSVKFVPEGQEGKLDTDRESLDNTSSGKPDNGKGHWYLVRNDQSVDNPDLPPEIDQNITIGTSTGQALAYMADLEDLRKRIGEVRYGAQDGLWAKAFAKQDSVNGHHSRGFEQEAYGINIGFDKLVGTDETSSWLIGAAFRYGTADQEGLGVAGSATGELDEYSVKAYATWMHESGSYADFVLQAGRYDQELKGLDNTGTGSTHADYDTWGYGASIEIGHMFTIANAEDDRPWFNHWFIEPQFELSYFRAQGADYRTSTGMKVEQDDADFLTGRAGLVIGKKFNYGTADDLDKRYFQAALIGGVKHEFLGGDQTIHYTGVENVKLSAKADDIAGTRLYYGVNMDWQLAQNLRLFGEVSREEGDGYTKDYDVSIGLKYSF